MAKISELFPEYVRLADGLRTGAIPSSPENEAAYKIEDAKVSEYRKNQRRNAIEAGWWNLPIAASCWHGDAKHIER